MRVVLVNADTLKGIVCFFRRFPHNPRDGCYEIRKEQGEQPTAVARYTLAVDRRFKRDEQEFAEIKRLQSVAVVFINNEGKDVY